MSKKGIIFLSLIYCLLTGCGQTYTTSIRNDPAFVQHPFDDVILRESGEPFVQRESSFVSKGELIPKEGERYKDFKQRIFNTLVLQENTKNKLTTELFTQEERFLKNEELLTDVQKKNLDLRLTLARLDSEGFENHTTISYLFTPYTVVKNDTLQKIAYSTYGNYDAWLMIYRFNIDELQKGPNKIRPGQILLLPNIQ